MDAGRLKVIATAILLLSGAILGVAFANGSQPQLRQSEGLIIDYGGYDTLWTGADLSSYTDCDSLLDYAAGANGLEVVRDQDGTVTSVGGKAADDTHSWGFWVMENGSDSWMKAPSDAVPSDYRMCAWAYCADGDTPATPFDASGNSIYGYPQAMRTVSLAPAITEIIGALNATSTLVGADQYSNYPDSVAEGKASGRIAVTGGYTNPSFESIIATDPDIVFCDSSQYLHNEVQKKLIDNGYNAVSLYDGQDIDTVLKNIFIVGTVMGYGMAARSVISDIQSVMSLIMNSVDSDPLSQSFSTLITLSADKSPWASGSGTYAHDAVVVAGGSNILSEMDGWVHVNSEVISKGNPQVIIVLHSSVEGTLDYGSMLENMSAEWKSTDAYKNGRVYLLTDDAADMAQRPSPRVAQLAELVARIIQPDVFADIEVPKVIGNDYRDYLVYSKNMDFNN